ALLTNDGPALFLPTSDEEKSSEEKKDDKKDDKKDAKADKNVIVKIDVEGFENRVRAIPGASDNYRNLQAVDNGVLYLTGRGPQTQLKLYNIDSKKEETIIEGIVNYDLSADRKKLIFRKGNDYGIASVQPGQKATEGLLGLSKMEIKIDPKAEWRQIFVDGWRTLRDWFYDPNMHGVDWKKMRERYEQLVPYVATRSDLDFILGELGGEL